MLKELLKCSLLTSVVLTGCNTVPKEDNSSILMEDVIVERTTVRSTTQNPKPKSSGGVVISGDNITVGTIIVNSPNAKVDNSTNTSTNVVSVNQNQNNGSVPKVIRDPEGAFTYIEKPQGNYNNDRDFFNGIESIFTKLIPSFVSSSVQHQR
jgi:hypothetical protein